MEKHYIHWLDIKIQHPFFKSGTVPGMQIQPSSQTRRLFQQYDLKLNPQPFGIQLFYGEGDQIDTGLRTAPFPLVFNFEISFTSAADQALFLNCTELSFTNDEDQKYFFFNEYSSSGWTEQLKNLSKTATVGKANLQQIAPLALSIELPHQRPLSLQIRDASGRIVHQEKITQKAQPDSTFIVDLRELDWGIHKLTLTPFQLNDTPDHHILEENFCRLPKTNEQTWGVIQLQLNQPTTFDHPSELIPYYELVFLNRSTRWRYYLVNSNNLKFDHFSITKNRQKIDFKLEEKTLPNGVMAKVLILDNPIALLEDYPEKLLLELQEGTDTDASNIQSIPLSYPNASQIRLDRAEGEIIAFSDMYLYL